MKRDYELREFKFDIGNSSVGDIGAVLYVKATDETAARKAVREFLDSLVEPATINSQDGNITALIYFGDSERIAKAEDVEEV